MSLRKPTSPILLGSGIVLGLAIAVIAAMAYHTVSENRVCSACHSMGPATAGWEKSMHAQFACTDCHLPYTNTAEQVVYKIGVGARDLFNEFFETYPGVISISHGGRDAVNGNCLRCHRATVERTMILGGGRDCVKCHRFLVHGRGQQKEE